MELANRFITSGILFLLTLAFGFWLSHAGKPYNGLLFNVHKLIALGCVVLAGIQVSKTLHAPNGLLIALLAVSALCVIVLFASGALMSAGKLDHALMLTIHRVAPVVLVVGWGVSMFLLKSSP
jgi:hypothetical protein